MSKSNSWSEEKISGFQRSFIAWYQINHRKLPWRMNQDPYRIWISEIMLQQTRVETVIDYFNRFMTLFPTIQDLASAPDDKLLKAWEGLGYYSRARNLKIAAQQIVEEYHGEMPHTTEEIRSLKGIGPYTAGAIASIAFGLPEPAVDGNVMRVVSRLFMIEDDIAKASTRKIFETQVRKIIDPDFPGEFNQAFMDLGSSICTPTSPKCSECPIQEFCLAKAQEQVERFPVKSKKAKPKPVYYVAKIIEDSQGAFLLQQRPSEGLLANMWLFPLEEVSEVEYHRLKKDWQTQQGNLFTSQVSEEMSEFFLEQPEIVWQERHLGEVTHIFSHLKWFILPFYGRKIGEFATADSERWVASQEFSTFVFPKPQQKLVNQLEKNQGKQIL